MSHAELLSADGLGCGGVATLREGNWLDITPESSIASAFATQLPALLEEPKVTSALVGRGADPALVAATVGADLHRMAHAVAVLTVAEPSSVLASVLPARLSSRILRFEHRLD